MNFAEIKAMQVIFNTNLPVLTNFNCSYNLSFNLGTTAHFNFLALFLLRIIPLFFMRFFLIKKNTNLIAFKTFTTASGFNA